MNRPMIRVNSLTLERPSYPLTVAATVTIEQPRGPKSYTLHMTCHERRHFSPFAVEIRAGAVPRKYRSKARGAVYDAVDSILGMMGGWVCDHEGVASR